MFCQQNNMTFIKVVQWQIGFLRSLHTLETQSIQFGGIEPNLIPPNWISLLIIFSLSVLIYVSQESAPLPRPEFKWGGASWQYGGILFSKIPGFQSMTNTKSHLAPAFISHREYGI